MLELLIANEEWPVPIVVPQLPGTRVDRVVGAALESVTSGRRVLLPAPPPDASWVDPRDWHADAWHSLSDDERSRIALATGPTAAFIAQLLGAGAELLVSATDPITAVGSLPVPVPRLHSAPDQLADGKVAALRQISNPQSRALLSPWHRTDELPLLRGDAGETDRWLGLLDEVLARMTTFAPDELGKLAEQLTSRLRCSPKLATKAAGEATRAASSFKPPSSVRRQQDAVLALNWLDAELFARCAGRDLPDVTVGR